MMLLPVFRVVQMPDILSNLIMLNMFFTLYLQAYSMPDKLNIIGNGVVIDPAVFKKEIEELGPPVSELIKKADNIK